MLLSAAALLILQNGEPAATRPSPGAPLEKRLDSAMTAVKKGVDFLVSSQRKTGAFGDMQNNGFNSFWNNPETPRTWIVATTGLVAMTLMSPELDSTAADAAARGLRYICDNSNITRPADWDTDNTWGYIYGLNALSRGLVSPKFQKHPDRDLWLKTAQKFHDQLKKFQSPTGGWGYYAFQDSAYRSNWATSFMTAAGVLAILEAREAGVATDEKVLAAAVAAVKRCRLPNGAYSYDVMTIPDASGLEFINQTKGSLSRIQVCNLALRRAGEKMPDEELERGLDEFFLHHKFLDVARQKPIPHEAYYANAGYFYYFGHYYAAGVIEALPEEKRARYSEKLQKEIIKTQDKDGSMWDFHIANFQKHYGTSFGIMTVLSTMRAGRG